MFQLLVSLTQILGAFLVVAVVADHTSLGERVADFVAGGRK